jgi:pimeloyl-ACP methyl ester carboxylesterase
MQANPAQVHPRRRIRRAVLVVLMLLVILGASYEAVSEAVDLRRYPPPGQMVEMGGYALHLNCIGQGSPTVILEAGLGGGVATWPLVQSEAAKVTRVCSYDRSGFAWSGGTAPESGQEVVTRLHELLQRAGLKEPYILVGHSLGGLYSQLYAATFPEGSHEQDHAGVEPPWRRAAGCPAGWCTRPS